MLADNAIRRVVIESVRPEIDGGRFPIKRTIGEKVIVRADVFTDGHDSVAGVLMYRRADASGWNETPLRELANDRWWAAFEVSDIGRFIYTLNAWVDRFKTWRQDASKKIDAEQDIALEMLTAAELVAAAASRAQGSDKPWLARRAEELRSDIPPDRKVLLAMDEVLLHLMDRYPDRSAATRYDKELGVVVDRERARFSAWYEMFPRSCGSAADVHGSFKDCEQRIPYVAHMGFDVLYLPPVHPIGRTHRKGKNNSPVAGAGDPGSPWAIGAEEGGHRDIHPQLGTLEDFRDLVRKAGQYGMDVAIDLAFQCSPDHPFVSAHPEWYRRRPDGSIQYAENPPKKYEDIYPFDFESDRWKELAAELKDVVAFWIDQGVRIFRVDNPHTKPFSFWEWLIDSIKSEHPEVIFLAEAFTRPKPMKRLAKLGFTQSYTYFAWRNTGWEIQQYLNELAQTETREYLRPNFWPNTPDILPEYLQMGGRSAFIVRLILAATLGASYGIYGPAFELCVNTPKAPGSEEYLDSEKYEIRTWDIRNPNNLKDLIARVNRIRRENPALQRNEGLRFHPVDNDALLCYTKQSRKFSNIILVAVNLDPHHAQTGWMRLGLEKLGLDPEQPFQAHDLLSDARYLWHGKRNYLELNPRVMPAHIFRIRRKVRSEHDFDYFL